MDSGRLFFDPSIFYGNSSSGLLIHGDGGIVQSMEEYSDLRMVEVIEDECYDESFAERKRRLSHDQVHFLEKSFEEENKLEPERKVQLAIKLGLQPRQVAVWFQNRRARWKTKRMEKDYNSLKSSFHRLLSEYDTIIKENNILKSELASLTEMLQKPGMRMTKPGLPGPLSKETEDLVEWKVSPQPPEGIAAIHGAPFFEY